MTARTLETQRRSKSPKIPHLSSLASSLGVSAMIALGVSASCGGSTVQQSDAGDQDASGGHTVLPSPADAQPAKADAGQPTNGAPLSRAFVRASLAASNDANQDNLCNFSSASVVMAIGVNLADPVRVSDGDAQMGGAIVNVTCSVGGGYDVSLSASLGGNSGGSLLIVGHVDATSGGQSIHAVLNVPFAGGTFAEDTCTIAYTYGGSAVQQAPPVAPGRIWAHLSCPTMVNDSGNFVHLMNGTSVPETCDGEVDFVFENCSQ